MTPALMSLQTLSPPVGDVSDGEDMGRHLVPLLALIDLYDLLGVDG